ncbi:MAG: ABC transporter ATP-binding protein [Spartobacteria bacterium]|nr:ABC transporter ATP-binding protein [Spartobacteria bacterium]
MTNEDTKQIISMQHLGKRYLVRSRRPYVGREVIQRYVLRRDNRTAFWALRDINVSINCGESVAIVGRNGAGKSTLLGLVAGTIYPTEGSIHVGGRIGALLELGAGFHPDLTGRENIFLNASLLGLTKEEVVANFNSIVAFSELRDFIEMPLRNYSSGMQVRLGFAVAIHINPSVIIMDEVFSVGDQSFQKKCLDRIHSFKEEGRTLLFVTHGLAGLKGICERAIWLDQGRLSMDGPLDDVLEAYTASCA